jgi:hypothetical protein
VVGELPVIDQDLRGADATQQVRAARIAGGRDDGHALLGRDVHRSLAQRGSATADQDRLPRSQAQALVQPGPRGRVDLRQRHQVRPRQRRADRHHVAGRYRHQLGVAAVAGPAHVAEDGHHGSPGSQPPAGIGLHRAGAFNARHLGDLPPGPAAHVGLGVVQAERGDPDQDLPGAGTGPGRKQLAADPRAAAPVSRCGRVPGGVRGRSWPRSSGHSHHARHIRRPAAVISAACLLPRPGKGEDRAQAAAPAIHRHALVSWGSQGENQGGARPHRDRDADDHHAT